MRAQKITFDGKVLIDLTMDTATAEDVTEDAIFHTNTGEIVQGTIAAIGAQTYIPTTADQFIPAGKCITGTQTIKGDPNLVPSNIASGITIFGVVGTHETTVPENKELGLIQRTLSQPYTDSTITIIGAGAFAFCQTLPAANFPACTSMGSSAFYSCTNLTTISFPVCVTIGPSAFQRCSSLTSIDLPLCTMIPSGAFSSCIELICASLPNCTHLSNYAFAYCWHLLSLYLLGSSVCSLQGSMALFSTPIASYTTSTGGVYGSIYVPTSLYSIYIASQYWSFFASRFVSV